MRGYTFTDRLYYQYLNIDRNAIPEVVTAAYRGLMKKYHPDSNLGDKTAEEKAKKIIEAYEVLSDLAARRAYDEWLDSNRCRDDEAGRKQAETGSGNNAQQTYQKAQGYKVDFDQIRNQAFESYASWHSAKCEEREKEAIKKRSGHTAAAVFMMLFLAGACGTGYVYRSQLPDWVKNKIPAFTANVQAAPNLEYITLPSIEEQEAMENGQVSSEAVGNEDEAAFWDTYSVTADIVNVRPTPSSDQERVTTLSGGNVCTGTGNVSEDGSWIEICLPGKEGETGWVYAKYLSVQGQAQADTDTLEESRVETHYEASSQYMGMTVTANLKDNDQVQLTFDNNTSTEFSIGGWERPQEACLVTTKGEYWTKFNTWMGFDIETHSTSEFTLSFENVEGEARSLTIHEITSLVNGLPTFGRAADVTISFS